MAKVIVDQPSGRRVRELVCQVEGHRLKSRGFLLTQNLDQFEVLELDEFRVFQIAINEIEERTHLRFADEMRHADTFAVPEAIADRHPLSDPAEIQW